MYDVTNSTSLWAAFFFIFLLILGAMLGLNLIIAILHDSYYFSDKSRTAANAAAASRTTTINLGGGSNNLNIIGGSAGPGAVPTGSPPIMATKAASIAPAPERLPTADLGLAAAADMAAATGTPLPPIYGEDGAATSTTLEVPPGWDPNFPGRRDSVILPPPYVSRMAASPRDSILGGFRNASTSFSPTDMEGHPHLHVHGSGHHKGPSVSSPVLLTGKGVFQWPRVLGPAKQSDSTERQISATGTAISGIPTDDQSRPPSPQRINSQAPAKSAFVINITPAIEPAPLPSRIPTLGDALATEPLLSSSTSDDDQPVVATMGVTVSPPSPPFSATSTTVAVGDDATVTPERKSVRGSYAEQRMRALSDVEEADLETRSPPSERNSSHSGSHNSNTPVTGATTTTGGGASPSKSSDGKTAFELDDTLTDSQRQRSEQGIRRLFGVESISIKRNLLTEPPKKEGKASRRSLPSPYVSPPSLIHGRSISTNPTPADMIAAGITSPLRSSVAPLSSSSTVPTTKAPLPPPPPPPTAPAPPAPLQSSLSATALTTPASEATVAVAKSSKPISSSMSSDHLAAPSSSPSSSSLPMPLVRPANETDHKRRASLIRMYASDTDLLHSTSPPRVDYYTGQVMPALPSPVASLTTQTRALSPHHISNVDPVMRPATIATGGVRPLPGRLFNTTNGKLVFGAALSARYERELRKQKEQEALQQAETDRLRRLAKSLEQQQNEAAPVSPVPGTTTTPTIAGFPIVGGTAEAAESLRANRRGVVRTDRRKGSEDFNAISRSASKAELKMTSTAATSVVAHSAGSDSVPSSRRASNLKSRESNESTTSKDGTPPVSVAATIAIVPPTTPPTMPTLPPSTVTVTTISATTGAPLTVTGPPKGATLAVPGHAHGSVPSSARNSLVPPMNLAHLVIPDSRNASFSAQPGGPTTISSTIAAGELALQQALEQSNTEMTASGRVRFLSNDKSGSDVGKGEILPHHQQRRVSQNDVASWKGTSGLNSTRRQSTMKDGIGTPRRNNKVYTIGELRRLAREVVNHRYWALASLLAVVINTLLMASDHVGIDPTIGSNLELATVYLTYIFAAEIAAGIFANGVRFFYEAMNLFDCFIITINIIEIGIRGTSSLSAFRAIRLLHIFRLGDFTRLNKLANRLKRALMACRANFFVFVLFNFIFTLMGMSFFGANMNDPTTGESYRYNFDTFAIAFVTTFQVTTTENWPDVMTAAIQGSGWLASLYFIVLICICTYILLSLFLAILLSFFGELTPTDKKIAKMRWRLSIRRIIGKQKDERRATDTKKRQRELKAQLMDEIRAKSTPVQPLRRGHTQHNINRLSSNGGFLRSGSSSKQLPIIVVSPTAITGNSIAIAASNNTTPPTTSTAVSDRNAHRRSLTATRRTGSGALWVSGDHTRAHRVSNINMVQERFRADLGGSGGVTTTTTSGGDSGSDSDHGNGVSLRRTSGSTNTKRLSGRASAMVMPLPSLIRSMSQQERQAKEKKHTEKVMEAHAIEVQQAVDDAMKAEQKETRGNKVNDGTATITNVLPSQSLSLTTSSSGFTGVSSPLFMAAIVVRSSSSPPLAAVAPPSPRHSPLSTSSTSASHGTPSRHQQHHPQQHHNHPTPPHHRTRRSGGMGMDLADISEAASLRAATEMRREARAEEQAQRLHHHWQRPLHTLPATASEIAGPGNEEETNPPPRPQDGLMGVFRAAMGSHIPPQSGAIDDGSLLMPLSVSNDSLSTDRPSSPPSNLSTDKPLTSSSSSRLAPSLSSASSIDATETKRMPTEHKDSSLAPVAGIHIVYS
jgi:hypothetical protein